MPLDKNTRDRVVLLAGKVGGVDCPNCEFRSRDVRIDTVKISEVICPKCGATILSEEQKSELRQAGKL